MFRTRAAWRALSAARPDRDAEAAERSLGQGRMPALGGRVCGHGRCYASVAVSSGRSTRGRRRRCAPLDRLCFTRGTPFPFLALVPAPRCAKRPAAVALPGTAAPLRRCAAVPRLCPQAGKHTGSALRCVWHGLAPSAIVAHARCIPYSPPLLWPFFGPSLPRPRRQPQAHGPRRNHARRKRHYVHHERGNSDRRRSHQGRGASRPKASASQLGCTTTPPHRCTRLRRRTTAPPHHRTHRTHRTHRHSTAPHRKAAPRRRACEKKKPQATAHFGAMSSSIVPHYPM